MNIKAYYNILAVDNILDQKCIHPLGQMSHKTRNNDMLFVLLTAMWSAKGVNWSILVPLIFFVGAGSLRIL